MGHTIQFASHTIAYAAILCMEHDPTVRKFYDQPEPIKLTFQHVKGRQVSMMHNPGYFVLRQNSAGWEEWKDERSLIELSQKQPNRYQRRDDGLWQCSPGQKYADQYGLYYHIHSSAELRPVLVRNLRFLEDYLLGAQKESITIESSAAKAICERVSEAPGMTIHELLDNGHVTKIDDLYHLIARGDLYVDLEVAPLANLEHVRVFIDAPTAHAYALSVQNQSRGLVHLVSTITFTAGQRLTWDGTPWTIVNVGERHISLLNADKHLQDLEIATFETYIEEGRIKGVPMDHQSDLTKEAQARLKQASPADCEVATRRYGIIESLLRGQPPLPDDRTPARTRRAWIRKYRLTEQQLGNGFIGLLPQRAKKGNRRRKLSEATLELMRKHIETTYETLKQQRKTCCY